MKEAFFHNAESITPKWNMQKSSTKAAQSKGVHWFQLALPSETKKKKKPTGWLMVYMGVKTNLSHWRYCCRSLRSHTKPQWLFSVSHCYMEHGSIHLGQPLVFKSCHALTIAQPTSPVGQCGLCTGSCSCFIYTEQICCSFLWEVLRKDKHGIIAQKLLASFSGLWALAEATHTAIAGVSRG